MQKHIKTIGNWPARSYCHVIISFREYSVAINMVGLFLMRPKMAFSPPSLTIEKRKIVLFLNEAILVNFSSPKGSNLVEQLTH